MKADATEVGSLDQRATVALAGLFGTIAALTATDLAMDAGEGASMGHMAVEGLAMLVGLIGLILMIREWIRARHRARRWAARSADLSDALEDEAARASALEAHLEATRADALRWRDETHALLDGLGAAIDRQFDRWGATRAEKEVGLLLLKGLSHKDIAAVRGTSDTTTRQQARSLYKKAGLDGRNDLSAFFLEELLLPMESASSTVA